MNNSEKNKKKLSPNLLLIFGLLLLSLTLTLLIPIHTITGEADVLKEGEIAREVIIAPFTYDILKSDDELAGEKEEAKEKVLAVFNYEEDITAESFNKLRDLEEDIQSLRNNSFPDSIKKVLMDKLQLQLSKNTIEILFKNPTLFEDIRNSVDKLLDTGIIALYLTPNMEAVESYKEHHHLTHAVYLVYAKNYITLIRDSQSITVDTSSLLTKETAVEKELQLYQKKYANSEILGVFSEILNAFIKPNVFYNSTETIRQKEIEAAKILPYTGNIVKGTKIIEAGQAVTKDIAQSLRSLKKAQNQMELQKGNFSLFLPYLGNFLIVLFLLTTFAFSYHVLEHSLFENKRRTGVFLLLLLLNILIIKILFVLFSSLKLGILLEYALPYFAGTIIIALIFEKKLGILFNVFIAILSGIILGWSYTLFLYVFLAGSFLCWAIRKIDRKTHLIYITIFISFLSFAYLFLIDIIKNDLHIQSTFLQALSAISCSLCSMFLGLFYPFFEKLAKNVSRMTLMDLMNINHPLLERLSMEAPGTFQHSTHVANMACAAAKLIGEDALLTRACAYYHDIGKISKAGYFIENASPKNETTFTENSLAALQSILASHIRDGLLLSNEYHIPQIIQDVIIQHHGTSPVRQPKNASEKSINPASTEFLYPGPKPQTKIAALIMFADLLEMAVRTGELSSIDKLWDLVKSKQAELISSTQLDECDISILELTKASEAFIPVLSGIARSNPSITG